MADWKQKVELGDLYKAYEADEITMSQMAAKFVIRLEKLHDVDGKLAAIIDEFKHIANDEDTDDGLEWNIYLKDLYNWADVDHRLWINTF